MATAAQANTEGVPPRADRTVVVASRYGTLTALRAADGQVLWRRVLGPRMSALAQDGERVYVSICPPLPGRICEEPIPAEREGQQPRRRLGATPGWVLALEARDGALLWMREGWRLPAHQALALAGGMLYADEPTEEVGCAVSARDAASGEIRWRYTSTDLWGGLFPRLIAVGGGRVFVDEPGHAQPCLRVLDARTGALAWSCAAQPERLWLSECGGYVMMYSLHHSGEGIPIRQTGDGTVISALPGASNPFALTEQGVVYAHQWERGRIVLAALNSADRSERWRVEGIEAQEVALRGDALYYADMRQPAGRAEVGALDCRTGQRLWRWRSPKRLAGLLRPWVLVHAALQSRRAIADARAAHSRHVIWRELTHGQWRHPAALAGRLRMAVDEDTAYISTSMGLFALRTADGCLRWHALPTADLSLIAPAVAAERGER